MEATAGTGAAGSGAAEGGRARDAGIAARPERPAHAEAQTISARGVATFAALMEELSTIRRLQTDIARALEDFATLLEDDAEGSDGAGPGGHGPGGHGLGGHGPGADDGAETDSGGMETLPDRLARLRSALWGLAEATGARAAGVDMVAARGAVSVLARCGRSLAAVATLSRTTAVSAGIRSLDDYTDALAATAAALGEAANDVLGRLDALAARAGATLEECRTAVRDLDRLGPAIEGRLADLARIGAEEHALAGEIAGEARRCGAEGRAQLKGFVSAMQFSDRMAQQLDHVAAMLAHDDPHLDRLAAAQMRGAAEAMQAVSEEVGAALDGLSRLARDGADLLTQAGIAAAARATLAARAEMVETALRDLRPLDRLLRVAETEATHVSETAAAARANFRRLAASARDLSRLSVNATLVAARSGDARGPLSALSTEVRSVASRSLSAAADGEARLGTVAQGAEASNDAVAGAGRHLRTALDRARAEAEAGASRAARLESLSGQAGETAAQLLALLSDAQVRLSGLAEVSRALGALAEALDGHGGGAAAAAPRTAPDADLLARIYASYTMDEERAVHAALYGAPEDAPGAAAPSPAATADDIDDLLF
ncbi:MAG: ImpA-related N-terminal [Rhodobacteraceae bacterium HLUCCA09]|nr:MAG: ImpA-related N-terminal [Rhodobacteraceae bacterium HLUCCA09]